MSKKLTGKSAARRAAIEAAMSADWQQVALNSGPPCFHVDTDGRFCFRALRWDGHDSMHRYKPLNRLLTDLMPSSVPPVDAA